MAGDVTNFIRQLIDQDLIDGKNGGQVTTRFPPEPNGYLHIGHAKSLCLNFGVAEDYQGQCFLRFDDTNPSKERLEYVESIKTDVRWLGFEWQDRLRHSSDYFERLFEYAVELIEKGKAYVCSLSSEEIREHRGTLQQPGRDSPHRGRSVAENLELFTRMRAGEFANGTHVLRAKIDMASPNLNLRDPVVYRIVHMPHQMTGDGWCIYPMYDYTQCLSDSIEGVTHSLCTLEFEDHRPLYDWFLDNLEVPCHPQQIEFSRLNLSYTVMSKRMLTQLVDEGRVSGWDDPRMPTIVGLRRRGYTPASVRDFCSRIGVTKKENHVQMGVLENCIREDLGALAPRLMCVLRPLKLVIENYPADQVEYLDAPNHPGDESMGTRQVPFCREVLVEREDFMQQPARKFFRLAPGREVRLKYAYLVTCTEVLRDPDTNEVVELRCTYDPASRGGTSPDGRKVKGTLHWVSRMHGVNTEVRLYDRLFTVPSPTGAGEGESFKDFLNPDSKETLSDAMIEPSALNHAPETRVQFERQGYFCLDSGDSTSSKPVYNRTVTLRDSWAKLERAAGG